MNRQFVLMLSVGAFAALAQTPRYVSDTEGLTAADIVEEVRSGNRDLRAAREQLRQAEARLLQSGLRPNPTVEAAYATERLTDNKGAGGYTASYTHPFELGGQRGKRMRVAEFGVELARAQIADAERLAVGQARTLYSEAVAAAARLDLLQRTVDLNRQMLQVTLAQRKAGDASRLDETLLRATANQVAAQRFQAETQVDSFLLQIKNLMGRPPDTPLLLRAQVEPAAVNLTEEAAISAALAGRPDLKAGRLREEMADAGIDLAKAQIYPTIGVSVHFSSDKLVLEDLPIAGSRYVEKDREVSFGVSIPLPLFNRQQGVIAESVSQRLQAKAQREATELSIRREVAASYRSYQAAAKTLELLRTGVVGQNQESFQIVRLAYQLGELRLLDVINQQRILIDAQTAYVAAQRDYFVAAVDLDRALGR
jgi:cobalt-zinc-cadmium efflux system outer membrane protein